jgi:hypothetical protein
LNVPGFEKHRGQHSSGSGIFPEIMSSKCCLIDISIGIGIAYKGYNFIADFLEIACGLFHPYQNSQKGINEEYCSEVLK